jgi:hypothetical protein
MGIATRFVAEMGPSIGLVGALVVGEAYIAMDAKQGATIGARVGDEVRTDLPQVGPNVTDEVEHGAADIPLIALLVGLKPLTSVLTAQVLKKGKQCGVKVGRCRHV